ncbi:hypothetical protein SESBI_42443 [Sesbania bispinosa]|nr:hypothetical protein SESBI_42443 [Sesbania bispinosa]
MASKFIPTTVILLAVSCLLLTMETSVADCSSADANAGSLKDIRNRKMLSALKDKETVLKASLQGFSRPKYGEKSLSSVLRKVPMGPNPLHNNVIPTRH